MCTRRSTNHPISLSSIDVISTPRKLASSEYEILTELLLFCAVASAVPPSPRRSHPSRWRLLGVTITLVYWSIPFCLLSSDSVLILIFVYEGIIFAPWQAFNTL
ncbi:hypothetical protein BDR03DRAFT_964211 [Suillus americanus]|nr:hypothetical protein BDR03DRAFT_964211 [Suillus americanus]